MPPPHHRRRLRRRPFRTARRYLWALPTTLPGLTVAMLAVLTGGRMQLHTGVLEVHGGVATWLLRHATLLPGGARAMTVGHVVLGVDPAALSHTREHERVHVRQIERWGPLFFPAYAIASVIAWRRGEDFYRGNVFEREAYAVAG